MHLKRSSLSYFFAHSLMMTPLASVSASHIADHLSILLWCNASSDHVKDLQPILTVYIYKTANQIISSHFHIFIKQNPFSNDHQIYHEMYNLLKPSLIGRNNQESHILNMYILLNTTTSSLKAFIKMKFQEFLHFLYLIKLLPHFWAVCQI